MNKSHLFLALVLGLVLVQTLSAKVVPGPKSSTDKANSDDEDDSDDDDSLNIESDDDSEDEDDDDDIDIDEHEENPAPSCLLFGGEACHVECSITAQAYDVKAEGHCDENLTCQCHISGDVSFHEVWAEKFDADYVYRKINENDMVHEQAHRIFNFPLRTAEQFKQLFKPILSPYQFSKLKTHDDSMAAKFTEQGLDKVDTEAVQKYVTEKVGKMTKTYKSLLTTKYKDNFKNALENSKEEPGTLYNLTFRTRQLKNKALEDILKEHLKKNNLEEPQVDAGDDKCLAVILTNAVTNEIIKLNDEKSAAAAAAKKKAAAAKKPAGKKAPAKKPVAKKPAAKKPADESTADKSTADKKPADKSTTKPKPAAKAKSDAKKA